MEILFALLVIFVYYSAYSLIGCWNPIDPRVQNLYVPKPRQYSKYYNRLNWKDEFDEKNRSDSDC